MKTRRLHNNESLRGKRDETYFRFLGLNLDSEGSLQQAGVLTKLSAKVVQGGAWEGVETKENVVVSSTLTDF